MIMIDWQMWWQQHLLCTWSNKSSRYRMAAPRAKCKNYLLPVLEKGQSFDLIEYLYAHLPWHHAWNRDFIDLQQDWYTIFQIMFSSWIISLHNSTHSSQIKTDGPAISFRTSCWLLPQKEQYSSFPESSPLPPSSDISSSWLCDSLEPPISDGLGLQLHCFETVFFASPNSSSLFDV